MRQFQPMGSATDTLGTGSICTPQRLDPLLPVRTRSTLLLLATLVVACRTTRTSTPPNMSSAVIVRAMPDEAWQVVDGERVLGFVVHYATSGDADKAYFSVRNEHQQELGIVDAQGRAWRYRVHQREPDWLGSGAIASGARSILSGSDSTRLVPIALDRLSEPAAATSPR
jgi:hypothetical protein